MTPDIILFVKIVNTNSIGRETMTSNKTRGIIKERELKIKLIKEGYTCVRSRGSLGAVDLIAFNTTNVRFISVKRTMSKYYSYKAEEEFLKTLAIPPFATVELWIWTDKFEERKAGWIKKIIKGGIDETKTTNVVLVSTPTGKSWTPNGL